ncbi:BnaC03g35430D [Brassica napus]|uniref:BnaC03g35430D protein n=1 Tax=Brassica napus TaxID=3708 RepID=A0A078F0L2_BRANA|nr:BnaC03g35430D [Brassica napus]
MDQTVAWMRMAALVRRRAHRKERKLVTVRWIVSVGGVRWLLISNMELLILSPKVFRMTSSSWTPALFPTNMYTAQTVHVVIAATSLNSPVNS